MVGEKANLVETGADGSDHRKQHAEVLVAWTVLQKLLVEAVCCVRMKVKKAMSLRRISPYIIPNI